MSVTSVEILNYDSGQNVTHSLITFFGKKISQFTSILPANDLHSSKRRDCLHGETCLKFRSSFLLAEFKLTCNYGIIINWTASSEFGTYRLCEQRRFRRDCASAQSRQNLRCSLIQAVNQDEPSDRKPDLWPLWMAGHAQLKFVMTECSKTQIRLTGLRWEQEELALKTHNNREIGIGFIDTHNNREIWIGFIGKFLNRRRMDIVTD